VTQCEKCGTILPDQAKFCLQCGAPVEHAEHPVEVPPSQPQAPLPPLEFIQPALAGGMFLGFLSTMPFINAANMCCCMWVLMGGGIAAMLLAKQRPSGVTYGDGAYVGVLSGVFGAIIGTLIHIPLQLIVARMFSASQQQQLEDLFRQLQIEGPLKDWLIRIASGEVSTGTIIITFGMNLLMWSLFAMIGGILTVAILNKRAVKQTL
jgi:zinc-ribbon domain